jgi:hypothetical protein
MLWRNLWLKVPLLFAVIGHAELFEALTGRAEPWWQVGVALVIGAVIIPLGGEWIAGDAATVRWRRRGWAVAAGGALLHLALDAACLALPWMRTPVWKWGLAGGLIGGLIMAILLRGYIGGLRHPEGRPPPPWSPAGDAWPARLWRGAATMGGQSILVTVIGAAFVVAMLALLIARPELRGSGKLWFALVFFAGCAVVGVSMGLERRALLLRRPGVAWPWRRRRREVHVVTRDGLLAVHRRGALLYRWDAIAAVRPGTILQNVAALCVELQPDALPEPVEVEGGDSDRLLINATRTRVMHRSLHGVDLAIPSQFTETGPGSLLAQLDEALADPDRRASLPATADELRRLRAR